MAMAVDSSTTLSGREKRIEPTAQPTIEPGTDAESASPTGEGGALQQIRRGCSHSIRLKEVREQTEFWSHYFEQENVQQLKQRLFDDWGLGPPQCLVLVYRGKVLHNQLKMREYNIGFQSLVIAVLCTPNAQQQQQAAEGTITEVDPASEEDSAESLRSSVPHMLWQQQQQAEYTASETDTTSESTWQEDEEQLWEEQPTGWYEERPDDRLQGQQLSSERRQIQNAQLSEEGSSTHNNPNSSTMDLDTMQQGQATQASHHPWQQALPLLSLYIDLQPHELQSLTAQPAFWHLVQNVQDNPASWQSAQQDLGHTNPHLVQFILNLLQNSMCDS